MDKFLKITFLYFWVSFLSRLQVFSEIYLGICQVFLTSVVMCKKEKKGEGKKKSLRAFYSFSFKCIEKSILQYKMFRLYYKDGEGSFCLPKRRRDEGKKPILAPEYLITLHLQSWGNCRSHLQLIFNPSSNGSWCLSGWINKSEDTLFHNGLLAFGERNSLVVGVILRILF